MISVDNGCPKNLLNDYLRVHRLILRINFICTLRIEKRVAKLILRHFSQYRKGFKVIVIDFGYKNELLGNPREKI